MNKEEKLELVYRIFSPSAPIEDINLFAGRMEEIDKIREAIEERGQHVVMYGGRGVGKTSIANVLNEVFNNIIISKITCNRNDRFVNLWDKILSKIQFSSEAKGIGFNAASQTIYEQLRLHPNTPPDASVIESMLKDIPHNMLFIFDEFDSITDETTKKLMADTLKTLSDNVPQVTVLIVGISDNVNDLIGQHPSLERCLKQIQINRMTDDEADELISKYVNLLHIKIKPEITHKIIEYASGFPHYIHLLTKFAAKEAITADQKTITQKSLNHAVKQSIENSDHSLRTSYQKAVSTGVSAKNQFEDVIYASILAQTDDEGSFTPDDVVDKYNKLTNSGLKKESIQYNLGMLCREERGIILEKIGNPKNRKYRFRNPLMKAYVKLKLHKDEIKQ